MSFSFKWDAFAGQQQFQTQIRELLTNALNKKLPRILEDNITVLNLDWGHEPPSIEMLEIGDVAMDRFRGVFKLNYNGGATITVATKVQANLLNVYQHSAPTKFTMPKFVDANASFPIPLHLTLRNIKLQGTVIVVFSKSKGLTLVFRNDPLQSIEVSSTFDKFPTIASYLQQQIETQIRGLFREELPAVLYQLSMKYLPSYNSSALFDQAMKFKGNKSEQLVSFAEIETDKPVSLVNILHIAAMLSSRRTLALETPIMPTAIVRSELHHRALLSRLMSPAFNMNTKDCSIYEQLYNHAKYAGVRSTSQKPPKRRVIKLNNKKDETAAVSPEASSSSKNTPVDSKQGPAAAMSASRNQTIHLGSRSDSQLSSAAPIYSTGIPVQARVPVVEPLVQRIPINPFVRDTKDVVSHFPMHMSQRIMFPYTFFSHDDDLSPLPVQEIDELPPAYVA